VLEQKKIQPESRAELSDEAKEEIVKKVLANALKKD
jgi:hypothetical protein